MGNCQIEFFDIENERYLSAYTCSGPGEQGAGIREICFKLNDAIIFNLGETGYQINRGKNIYKLKLTDKNNQVYAQLTQYLWGWLPYQRFKGKLSNAGLATIKRELEHRKKDVANKPVI